MIDEETGEITGEDPTGKTSDPKAPKVIHTRGQLLDALRQSSAENMQQCAKRVGRNRRTVHNWINSADGDISPRLWGLILRAYHTDQAGAEEIANSDSSLKLKPSPVSQEQLRRATQNTADNEGRDPATRKPGEERWWRTSAEWFGFGQEAKPTVEGVKCYPAMHSIVLALLDAREAKGLSTDVADLTEAFLQYWVGRTLNTQQDELMGYFISAYLPQLILGGDIVEGNGTLALADHVHDSYLHMPQGDPRGVFVGGPKESNGDFRWVIFSSRPPVPEDLKDLEMI